MQKIDTTKKRTVQEWEVIFQTWSSKMDELYNEEERHDASMWNCDNPAEWMEPYNDDVFTTWCEYDVGSPYYIQKLNCINKLFNDTIKFEIEIKKEDFEKLKYSLDEQGCEFKTDEEYIKELFMIEDDHYGITDKREEVKVTKQ